MKSLHGLLLLLIIAFAVSRSVQAQNQTGFISLDCGLIPNNLSYVENTTTITYTSDADYIDSGVIGKISNLFSRVLLQQQYVALRSFPDGVRNCYNLNLDANQRYLIRGSFLYGNYDGLETFPRFDLHIGVNKWSSVIIQGTDTIMHEIIHVTTQKRLQVCLVRTGPTIPFISTLELRPLDNTSYVSKSGSLALLGRIFFSHTPSSIRYGVDIHDRLWISSFLDDNDRLISTGIPFEKNNYNVPQEVMYTAVVPKDAKRPWYILWHLDDIKTETYIYMHFAEVGDLEANETREFNINYNDVLWLGGFSPFKEFTTSVYYDGALSSPTGRNNISLERTANSTFPPLINAFEIYTIVDLLVLDTDKFEASAMMNIKTTYGLTKKLSWQGDPCSPQIFRWEGVDCNYRAFEAPHIISLNLSGSELIGTITSDISNLLQLKELDLSKNNLTGEIPAFFADMKLLKLINLRGNPNLNVSLPKSLQERINSNSLTLITDGTLSLKPIKNKIPLVAIIVPVAFVIGLLCLTIYFLCGRKKKTVTDQAPRSKPVTSNQPIMSKDRRVTYSEVERMTNKLERVLGQGGFGTVYYGKMEDTEVAVKLLSHTSAQGYKEFIAEVELLLRVHYRHLVRLVGYCDDGDNLALIYEYMANGDLREHMSGIHGGNVLTWGNRLQIAVEAAQGLEYLHNGCTPPMVHRDVKSTNILLNDRCQAKLADFGLSRSFPIDGEVHDSTAVAGTPGYLDPEYYRTNLLSEKSDVYSFGVVLLEIVTNQPVIDKSRERPNIGEWVGFKLTKGDIKKIVDPKLMDDYDTNGVWKVVEIAMACVHPSSSARPAMPQIVMELNECVASETARKQGSQEINSTDSVAYSATHASDFVAPGAR